VRSIKSQTWSKEALATIHVDSASILDYDFDAENTKTVPWGFSTPSAHIIAHDSSRDSVFLGVAFMVFLPSFLEVWIATLLRSSQ